MGAYRVLLQLEVTHDFYAGRRCRGIAIEPTPLTERVAARAGLEIQTHRTRCGVTVLFDPDCQDTLCGMADEAREDAEAREGHETEPTDLQLCFRGVARAPELYVVSDAAVLRAGHVAHFESDRRVDEGGGLRRLHRGARVGSDDVVSADAPVLAGLLARRDQVAPPMFTVRIRIGRDPAGVAAFLAEAPARFVIRYEARSTVWKYYLLGALRREDLEIVDAIGAVRFESLGEVSLSNGVRAYAFRSRSELVLREQSDYELRLRERGESGRALIQRLPVAGPHQIAREMVAGSNVSVSEIYING